MLSVTENLVALRASLAEAERILSELVHEYLQDECCDYTRINELIEEAQQFLFIRRAK